MTIKLLYEMCVIFFFSHLCRQNCLTNSTIRGIVRCIPTVTMRRLSLTLSAMKSAASTILLSAFSTVKFPINIFFSTKEGSSQNRADESLNSNTQVSANALHKISDATRGQFNVSSANFCARNPPVNIICMD